MSKEKSPTILEALYEGNITIGDIALPCYVLDGGVRVLSLPEVSRTFIESSSGDSSLSFLVAQNLQKYASSKLQDALENPVKFQITEGQSVDGIMAEVIPHICEMYINAERAGVLEERQKITAERARILHNGLANTGITGLVDEATGYQSKRAVKALAEILEQYLSKEAHEWTKTFPLDFYRQIYRLKDWKWTELENGKKPPTPPIVGKYTDNFIYLRIAPGVLNELRRRNSGMNARHHQWFNREHGYFELKMHIACVVAVMRASNTWDECLSNINRAFPIRWPKDSLFYEGGDDDE